MRLAILALSATLLHAADAAPSWVTEAARQTTPSYPPSVNAVVLLHEEHLNVAPDGTRLMTERGVIRILQASRNGLSAWRTYDTKSGRIRQFDGWTVSPEGKVTSMKKDQFTDHAITGGSLYNEMRVKELACGSGMPVGTVFAYEVVEEEQTVFTHYVYDFQEREPALRSRFSMTLPAGWEAKGLLVNHAPAEPATSPCQWTWELRDLPPIEGEEYAPSLGALQPRLWVAYFPTGENKAGLRPLPTWKSVSAWLSELTDPASIPSDTVRAKAADLTRDAKSELDRIRAIAAFAQQTLYVSVQMNLTRGGGYTPNAAAKVLDRNYGDCKDKAALMRALLKAAGIDSFLTVIFSGDRYRVKPEWASPMQFNHAILAIRVSPETRLDTIVEHPQLGRLLLFDPTSEWTPLGDLPEELQGSHALVIAGASGDLVKMPLRDVNANRIETSVAADLTPNGEVTATLRRTYHGQTAKPMRSLKTDSPDALKKLFESVIARRVGASSIKEVTGTDKPAAEEYEATAQFSALQFGQSMQNRLLIFRPGALASANDYGFPAKERKTPVRLRGRARTDVIDVKAPNGYKVDELPDPIALESAFGKYTAAWKANENGVRLEQSFQVHDAIIPATEYPAVREFFEKVQAAQASTVVLAR